MLKLFTIPSLRFFVICSLYIISYTSQAQSEIKFDRIGIDQGLSQGNVNFIMQDKRGFMWFATQDGLNRYDGYSMKVFKPNPNDQFSISNNIVKVLCEGKDGIIWAGTDGGGLNMYDPKLDRFYSFKNDPSDFSSLSNNSVYALYEDTQGRLWVGTFGGGVCLFDREKKTFTRFQNNPKDPYSLSGNAIRAIFQDKEGHLWIGVDGAGLNKWDEKRKRFIRYQHNEADPESLGSDIVLTVLVDHEGYFWCGSWAGGISKFDPRTGKAQRFKHQADNASSISGNETFMFCEDSDKQLWVCTRNGLDRYVPENQTFVHYKNDPLISYSLSFDIVISLCQDKSGVLWIGTEGGGVCKTNLKKKKFLHFKNDYKNPSSLSNNEVTNIIEDVTGQYWIATRGGVNVGDLHNNSFRKFISNDGGNSISSNNIQCLLQDQFGNIWIGANGGGLNKYDPKTGHISVYKEDVLNPEKLSNNAIFSLVEDNEGYIWLCTWGGGICRYDYRTDKFKRYPIDNVNLMKNVGLILFIDSEGTLWCGSNGHGLLKYEAEKDKFRLIENNPSNKNGISSNVIFAISESKDGYLWIGTGGNGIDRFDKKKDVFKNYNQSNGLINDVISAIQPDDKGNLWITTSKGLSMFNVKTEKFRNFDRLDGLQENSFNQGAAFKNARGQIIIGGTNGFNVFHPDSIKDDKVLPSVILTDLKIFNQSIIPGENSVLEKSIAETNELELSYKYYSFSFEFSALHYAVPSKNQYKYKMEGFDEDWITTTSDRRFASYTNLPGGTYTFRVIASNSDGIWNDKGVALKLIILPPFWKRWWFYLLCALVIGAGVFRFIKYRERNSLRQKIELEEKITLAIGEVEKQKKEILEQNDELQKRQAEEQQRRWFNEGVAKFSDILRENKEDIELLANSVLCALVRHISATQGGLFVLNDEEQNDLHLQLIASYALSKERLSENRIELGETLVGNCFIEKHTKYMTDLPNSYFEVESALGHSHPKSLLLVPLKLDEHIFGVLEIASFQEISMLEIEFIEKISENITSQLFSTKITMKTAKLLELSQRQADDLRLQEEQARHSIEQLQANREEALRLRAEAMSLINSMNHSIIRADFNLNGTLDYANTRFLHYFDYKSKEASGMNVIDFFADEERNRFSQRWEALLQGSHHIEEKFIHLTKNGEQLQLLSTFTVVRDTQGNMQKILYLGLDVANTKNIQLGDSESLKAVDSLLLRVELDKTGVINEANSKYLELMQYTADEIQDLTIEVFIRSEDLAQFEQIWQTILEGTTYEGEMIRRTKNGELVSLQMIYIPIKDISGMVSRVTCLGLENKKI